MGNRTVTAAGFFPLCLSCFGRRSSCLAASHSNTHSDWICLLSFVQTALWSNFLCVPLYKGNGKYFFRNRTLMLSHCCLSFSPTPCLVNSFKSAGFHFHSQPEVFRNQGDNLILLYQHIASDETQPLPFHLNVGGNPNSDIKEIGPNPKRAEVSGEGFPLTSVDFGSGFIGNIGWTFSTSHSCWCNQLTCG